MHAIWLIENNKISAILYSQYQKKKQKNSQQQKKTFDFLGEKNRNVLIKSKLIVNDKSKIIYNIYIYIYIYM